jgi:hypothetical protein
MNKSFLFAVGLALLAPPAFAQGAQADVLAAATGPYNPSIDAADFRPIISNKYYTLRPGMNAAYEQVTPRGVTHLQTDVSGETRNIMGVDTLVVRHREWLNGRLLEDTQEWVAQDRDGNVWYFGEAVEVYKNGKIVSRDGSWEAGVDGAKPGILMLNEPTPGASYRREYHPGRAEDVATVIAVGTSVTVPQGPLFQNCVHIRERSPLKKGEVENKYYCVGIGTMVLKEDRADRFGLVTFRKGAEMPPNRRFAAAP